MKNYPVVSVIIPTKNEESNILRCIRSVKRQDYKGEIEIILIDNHSSDKTIEIAKPNVSKVIIAGPERSAQRNIGAKKAKGKWLLFLDADMRLSKTAVKECVELSNNRLIDPIIAITEKGVGDTFWGKALALERIAYARTFWLQAARFFPRKHFLKYEGYDETLIAGEDWDITQRFRDAGLPNLYTKYSYVTHHERNIPLLKLLEKEIFYIKHIDKYAKKHPLAFSYQGSLLYRMFLWTRHWGEFIRHPILASAFICYKFFVWLMWLWEKRKLKL